MTPNDSQIDLLMRRHAKSARSEQVPGQHLDADALNAFAEGALPQAARSQYVSHLAACDECRKLASELSIHARGVTPTQTSQASLEVAGSWWQSLSSFIA